LTAAFLARKRLRSNAANALDRGGGAGRRRLRRPGNIGLSFAAPTIIGRSDMASVVIRSGLVQLSTPVAMR
jgi:hypothetical protein